MKAGTADRLVEYVEQRLAETLWNCLGCFLLSHIFASHMHASISDTTTIVPDLPPSLPLR
jgi:hypothetical protein